MTAYTKRARIVVPAAQQAAANTAAAAVDRTGGSRTFTVGLSADGEEPATHYVCDWALTEAERTALESELTRQGVTADIHDLDDRDPHTGRPSLDTILTDRSLVRITASL